MPYRCGPTGRPPRLSDIPGRVVLIGGSAVDAELGLFLRRYGAHVTILERSARLLSRDARAGGPRASERVDSATACPVR
jgi:pyruvate/2-oxoglutarate dehydrogenase complex dihydrolipoamide dehydrogenase (E3) component